MAKPANVIQKKSLAIEIWDLAEALGGSFSSESLVTEFEVSMAGSRNQIGNQLIRALRAGRVKKRS